MALADLVPSGDPEIGLFVGVMGLGFVVGIAGHLSRSPWLVAAGIALVFLGTLVLPLLLVGRG